MTAAAGKFGIDVSEHQGAIDWGQAKADGVSFAILRSVKRNLSADLYFEANYRGCRENGIPAGIYKYSYAQTEEEAGKEAEAVLRLLSGRSLELPVFIDVEDAGQRTLPRETLTAIVRIFLETVEAGGYQSGIYCNLDWYQHVLDVSAFVGRDFWIARYGKNDGQPAEAYRPDVGEVCWQYTSKGRVAGISGSVDLNLLYKDYGTVGRAEPEEMEYFSPPKRYRNGSTAEPVYSSTDRRQKIGSLYRWEECLCVGTCDDMACVIYCITGTRTRKTGWVKWLGGIQD